MGRTRPLTPTSRKSPDNSPSRARRPLTTTTGTSSYRNSDGGGLKDASVTAAVKQMPGWLSPRLRSANTAEVNEREFDHKAVGIISDADQHTPAVSGPTPNTSDVSGQPDRPAQRGALSSAAPLYKSGCGAPRWEVHRVSGFVHRGFDCAGYGDAECADGFDAAYQLVHADSLFFNSTNM